MKKLILWMIKVFKLDIPTQVTVEKIVERQVLPKDCTIDGDLYIDGNLIIINGELRITKDLITYTGKAQINYKKEE